MKVIKKSSDVIEINHDGWYPIRVMVFFHTNMESRIVIQTGSDAWTYFWDGKSARGDKFYRYFCESPTSCLASNLVDRATFKFEEVDEEAWIEAVSERIDKLVESGVMSDEDAEYAKEECCEWLSSATDEWELGNDIDWTKPDSLSQEEFDLLALDTVPLKTKDTREYNMMKDLVDIVKSAFIELGYVSCEDVITTICDGVGVVTAKLVDLSNKEGRLVLTCPKGEWEAYWGSLGHDSVGEFIASTDLGYLLRKISPQYFELTREIDYQAIQGDIQTQILEKRRMESLTKEEARLLWGVDWVSCAPNGSGELQGDWVKPKEVSDALFKKFGIGDEYYEHPTRSTKEFNQFSLAMQAAHEAIKEKFLIKNT